MQFQNSLAAMLYLGAIQKAIDKEKEDTVSFPVEGVGVAHHWRHMAALLAASQLLSQLTCVSLARSPRLGHLTHPILFAMLLAQRVTL